MSADKAFSFEQTFVAWGTRVEGHAGLVGTARDKRHEVARLGVSLLAKKKISKKCLASYVGCCVHPFLHCRCLMSLLTSTYGFLDGFPEAGLRGLPPGIVDKLLGCILFLASSETNIRAPVEPILFATHSTLARAGACSPPISQSLADRLYRAAEFRGEDVRLDWSDFDLSHQPTCMKEPSQDVDTLVQ